MVLVFYFVVQSIGFLLKIFIYSCLGFIKIFFATKQQKVTILLLISVVWVDAIFIYPYTGDSWKHVVVLFAPVVYLYNLGRSEAA